MIKLPSRQRETLNVAAWQERSVVNGPGERFVLWLQGCPRHCPGCINPELIPITLRQEIPVARMAERILSISGIKGVTYSGGEPFLQAAPLAALSERLCLGGLGIVCYTGYTLSQLESYPDRSTQELLRRVDLLIDGPFVEAQRAPLRWRGSTNQEMHFLTARYRAYATGEATPAAQVELSLGAAGLSATGFWPEALLSSVKKKLEE